MILATLAACSSNKQPRVKSEPPAAAAKPVATVAKPRLVVLIVIDQLPSWSFEVQAKYMKAGLKRLLSESVYYPRAQYNYALTFTSSGHAALATGAPPSVTGILANHWYDRKLGREVPAVEDPDRPLLQVNGKAGNAKYAGSSPHRLRVKGIADWLHAQTGGKGKAVAVALKDRAASLILGQHADIAVWYDAHQVAMTTSTWYRPKPPRWLVELAATHPIAPLLDYVWKPGSAALLARVTGNTDDAPGEGGMYGLGKTFPHDLRKSKAIKAFRATPIGSRVTTDTAIAALHGAGLGKDDVPDVLAVSYSSHDYAGHTWGQQSWERFDVLLHIDRQIGRLLDELDRSVGKGRYAVVLTSDHGVTHMVEQSARRHVFARRISRTAFMKPLLAAAKKALGDGKWIAAASASTVYLSKAFHALPKKRRDRAMDTIMAALRNIEGVGFVARTDRLAGSCDNRSGDAAFACRSIAPGLSGDIFVATAPNSIFSGKYLTGTTHGSPNPDDRFVPLLIRAPGLARKQVADHVSMLRVAATVATLLGIHPGPKAASPALP